MRLRLLGFIFLSSLVLFPRIALALPELRSANGFLALELSDSALCSGGSACVAVDVSVNAAENPIDVLLFDLHVSWDTSYWALEAIVDTGVDAEFVQMDAAAGFIDDLFGDVGLDPPVAAGESLFQLVFGVTGEGVAEQTVLEMGDLSGLDPFFDRAVLVADAGFAAHPPTPNARVVVPEPRAGLLLSLALVALGMGRRAGRGR